VGASKLPPELFYMATNGRRCAKPYIVSMKEWIMAENLDKKTPTMTSRQRVLNAIERKPVDRVPIDLGVHFSTGISTFAYWNLREYLGMPTNNIQIVDPVQLLARVDEDILERFHCDCILLQPQYAETSRWNPRDKYEFTISKKMEPKLDSEGNWIVERNNKKMRLPKGGFFFDGDWLNFDEEDFPHKTAMEAERIYKETDYFTLIMGLWGFFSEDVDFLCNMLTDPDIILEGNQKYLDSTIKYLGNLINTTGKYVQGIEINSDMGTQNAPFCNPSVYADLCAPFLEKLCDFIHENSDMKIFMHNCGSIKPFIPTLIECGIDVLNPIQISALSMQSIGYKCSFTFK